MRARIARAIGLGLTWILAAGAWAQAPSDPRLERAGSLLEKREDHPRAIALYREILADDPDALDARVWLARVLAWDGQYDESLVELDRLLETPDRAPTARVERAEVLSWASRTAEARQAFEEILEEHPDDVRAWLGLARVHRWSGRPPRAARAYQRALELGAGKEAEDEWEELRRAFPHWIQPQSTFHDDSDDFQRLTSGVRGSLQLGLATRALAELRWIRIQGDDALPVADTRDEASQLEIGIEHRFESGLRGLLALGGRQWRHAPGRASARLELELAPSDRWMVSAEVVHRDQLDASDSLLAAEEGITGTYPRLSVWRAFGRRWEGYADLGFGAVSDHNRRVTGSASLAARPWPGRELLAGIAVSALRYRDDSAFYYSPESDLGARFFLSHRVGVRGPLSVSWKAGLGYGRTRELGETSSGPEMEGAAGLTWSRGGWRLELGASVGRSQRATRYTSRSAHASLTREF